MGQWQKLLHLEIIIRGAVVFEVTGMQACAHVSILYKKVASLHSMTRAHTQYGYYLQPIYDLLLFHAIYTYTYICNMYMYYTSMHTHQY